MLSWLERGLAQPGDSGEITEFLIAPFQRKGEERGSAKAWVDRVYRERESQEARRILYVAATRAREELHLFARPACKEEDGSYTLVEPVGSLLATAWPALEVEVRARFAEWKAERAAAETGEEEEIESIAASGESNLFVLPSPIQPTPLRRLPPDYQPNQASTESVVLVGSHRAPSFRLLSGERVGEDTPQPAFSSPSAAATTLYTRHEGGLRSRALGTAVHTLLEELARLRLTQEWEAARAALVRFEPRIAAQVRAVGVDQPQAARVAAQALQLALNASRDRIGSWILSSHRSATSEAGWAGVVGGSLRAVRVDRVFQAGPTPGSEGDDCWWIIDYKTAHADNLDPAKALPRLRSLFAPQVEAYGEVLGNLLGGDARIFAGLYYPRMMLLDWWEL
jgi:ATP-dependent exoDNAse (exonuclease V) beta subunit